MRRHAWGFAVLAMVGLPLAASAQCTRTSSGGGNEAVSLRLRLEPGQSRRMVSTTEQTSAQTIMGQAQQMHQVLSMGIRFDVDRGASEGGHRVSVTYETVRVETDTPMGHLVYDSSDPESDPGMVGRIYAAILNHTITTDLAPDGSVTSVQGVDSLLSAMVASMPEIPGTSRADLEKMMKEQVSDRMMSQTMRQAFQAMPAGNVSVGDSWTCPLDLEASMPMHQVATWTVRSLEGGVATVDVSADLTSDSTTSVQTGLMSMRYALKGTNKATMQIDAGTGWVIRSTADTEMKGSVTMSSAQMGEMQVPMETHIHNTTRPAEESGAN